MINDMNGPTDIDIDMVSHTSYLRHLPIKWFFLYHNLSIIIIIVELYYQSIGIILLFQCHVRTAMRREASSLGQGGRQKLRSGGNMNHDPATSQIDPNLTCPDSSLMTAH